MHVDPHALITAALELEAGAARLRGVVASTRPARQVLSSGSDEVSTSAANSFNATSESLASSADRAVAELEDAAAALRRYAAAYEFEDNRTQADLASAPL
ncbi:PE domain-containing protein [Rhodococcus globerulus]|uniref:PE domain-containing protein n=1 Tax=Rhodococcus globerulus TaxID=33008 RepID=UPI001F31F652|nr:PE domain-containing protein [Rhodococcus globerulus]MCE4266272.1 PE domain-containing protein [Rhodococcus globerulus]